MDSALSSLLAMVDMDKTAVNAAAPEIPAHVNDMAVEAAKKVFVGLRMTGKTVNEAKAAAEIAFTKEITARGYAVPADMASAIPFKAPAATPAPLPRAVVLPAPRPAPVMDVEVDGPATDRDDEPPTLARVALAALVPAPVVAPLPAPVAPVYHSAGPVDAAGAARHASGFAALTAAGFAPARPLYTPGTRVNGIGVENARLSREEHDALPTVTAACDGLIATIGAERRAIKLAPAPAIGMDRDGLLTGPDGFRAPIVGRALAGLVNRLGYGGAAYLEKCPAELRAHNVNTWAPTLDRSDVIALRTREGRAGREVFAAVTDTYAPFDCDKVAAAVKMAAPADAKCAVIYDGFRAKIDVMFHSNVRPEGYTAGEFFKAGVRVSADDTGGGAVKVRSTAWQNLCLNLIIIDECGVETVKIRHVGDVGEMARRFARGFAAALAKLDHFLKAWGYACRDDVAAQVRASHKEAPIHDRALVRGVFNGILDGGAVKVANMKRATLLDTLVDNWESDRSSARAQVQVSRASIANAFTALHSTLTAADPFAIDDVEVAGGAMVWAKKPLPFVLEDAPAKGAARR